MAPCLALVLLFAVPEARVDLAEARRVADRAFRTELAGDYGGAEAAVEALLHRGTQGEPASALLRRYLDGLRTRRSALTGSPPDLAAAYRSLRDAPSVWGDLLWNRLPAPTDPPRVRLTLARLQAVDEDGARRALMERLRRGGVAVADDARFEVRLEVSADDLSEARHRYACRSEGGYTLLDRQGRPRLAGSGANEARSRRTTADEAREWSLRRLFDELAHDILFDLRLRLLEGRSP
jgi:hypothetical protein